MNKRPLFLRTVIALVVIAVFGVSMYPLSQRNFYDTFRSMLKDPDDAVAAAVIADAKEMEAKDPSLFASQTLLAAADAKGVELAKLMDNTSAQDNRDVMSAVRKEASSSIRLGLDLNGGVEFMLQLIPDEDFLAKLESIGQNDGSSRQEAEERMANEFDRYRDIAIEILRKRLESQKIFEAEISPSGSDYISIKAPIVAKDEKVKLLNLISMSAKLRFRLVHPENDRLVEEYLANPLAFVTPVGYELLSTSEFRSGDKPIVRYYFVENRTAMDGKTVTSAYGGRDQYGQRQIQLSFNSDGARQFARITTENVNRQLAIVLDGKLYCAPNINEPITGGTASISGDFSDEECKNIADALVSGSFPFQIKVDAVFDTDPKLGADNVRNGIWVGIWSMVAVIVFMCAYYLLGGVIASLALIINLVLIMGAMAAFDATLTLPGIAGIVLTIGMAVDSNVLIFERIREELRAGRNLFAAIDAGYSRALSAVVDANLTTLITSLILMSVGTGAIKGFAVTLSIGILTTLFSAVFLTRLIFDYLYNYCPNMKMLKMRQFFKISGIDFPKLWKIGVPLSLVCCLVSIGLFCWRGKDFLSVDFTGGTQVTFNCEQQVPVAKVESVLKDNGITAQATYKFDATSAGDSRKIEILIRDDMTAQVNNPKEVILGHLTASFPEAKFSGGLESSVGGLIGQVFIRAAFWAIFFSMIGIGAYLTLRYEFSYATASIVALAHDVIVTLGIYALLGRTISLTVVAAVLTVIGYSVNDKVVIFDRVRESVNLGLSNNYLDIINISINNTLSRTMLTGFTTLIVILFLFFGGGVAINDFVLIMLLGVLIGTYSSIFVAAPFVARWHRRVANLNR